jgi:hypothetical protein
MTIKQNEPKEDDSSIFEIFNRLNTGGVNLGSQEIRACLYYSDFYRMLNRINQNNEWRRIWGKPEEDNKSKDIEALFRSFALLCDHSSYNGAMNAFINKFAKKSIKFDSVEIEYFEKLFLSFLDACKNIPKTAFETKRGQFNVALFEGIFVAIAESYYIHKDLIIGKLDKNKILSLKNDVEFKESITHSTSHTNSVRTRINKSKEILL